MASLWTGQSWLTGGGLDKSDPTLFKKGVAEFVGASHTNGIVSFVLFALFIMIILVFRKRLTNILSKNKFWYIYGGVCIPFFIFGRYILFIVQSARAPLGTWTNDLLFQNIFGTNLCALLLIITSVIICIPKLRTSVGKWIAPWAFLGGILTMVGLAITKSANNFFMFLFFKQSLPWGDIAHGGNREVFDSYQYFSSHAWLIATSILILISTKKYSFSDVAITMGSILIYGAYVGIAVGISHLSIIPIQHDAGGFFPSDWQTGSGNTGLNIKNYTGVFHAVNFFHLKGFASVFFGLSLFVLSAFLISLAQYRFINFRGQETKTKNMINKLKLFQIS